MASVIFKFVVLIIPLFTVALETHNSSYMPGLTPGMIAYPVETLVLRRIKALATEHQLNLPITFLRSRISNLSQTSPTSTLPDHYNMETSGTSSSFHGNFKPADIAIGSAAVSSNHSLGHLGNDRDNMNLSHTLYIVNASRHWLSLDNLPSEFPSQKETASNGVFPSEVFDSMDKNFTKLPNNVFVLPFTKASNSALASIFNITNVKISDRNKGAIQAFLNAKVINRRDLTNMSNAAKRKENFAISISSEKRMSKPYKLSYYSGSIVRVKAKAKINTSVVCTNCPTIKITVTNTASIQPIKFRVSSKTSDHKHKIIKRSGSIDFPQAHIISLLNQSPSTQVVTTATQDVFHTFPVSLVTPQPNGHLLQSWKLFQKESQDNRTHSNAREVTIKHDNWTNSNAREITTKNYNLNMENVVKAGRNNSQLVDSKKEHDLITWFDNVNPEQETSSDRTTIDNGLRQEPQNVASGRQAYHGEEQGHCNETCGRKLGVCVMGNDFKPHCVVVTSDACEQFQCVNGDCVSTDGLYRCECYQGWVGPFCDKSCTLDCGENGFCGRMNESDSVACICHWNYTGYRCEDKRKIMPGLIEVFARDDELEPWKIAVVALLGVIALALVGFLLPYILWRRQWIPIRKFVFYFHEYEDDDDKEYDAFISYKSSASDERFILHHLYPKLEKELNFKLCLHFRDFPPGEPIANNIIRAIEGSRRTILILSPSFISSEWCRMEYQKAQYEMLKLKHKIIPIIIEDISDVPEIDKNLKTIINTVTYITWPGEGELTSNKRQAKFWKLLELSMPKRRSEYNYSVTSSGNCSSEVPLTPISDGCSKSIKFSYIENNLIESLNGSISSNEEVVTRAKGSSSLRETFSLKEQQSYTEEIVTIPLTPPMIRHDALTVLKCGSESQEVVKNRNGGHPEEPIENRKTVTNGSKNQFLTSDDHIVEIRQNGSQSDEVIITQRPRTFLKQFFV